jgi:hypothetical protein
MSTVASPAAFETGIFALQPKEGCPAASCSAITVQSIPENVPRLVPIHKQQVFGFVAEKAFFVRARPGGFRYTLGSSH